MVLVFARSDNEKKIIILEADHNSLRCMQRYRMSNGEKVKSMRFASYKETILKRYKEKIKLDSSEIVAIGDAANDLNMLLSAGLAIAYKATDVVKANIDNQINYTDLTSVLYFLGISYKK